MSSGISYTKSILMKKSNYSIPSELATPSVCMFNGPFDPFLIIIVFTDIQVKC